MPRQDTTDFLTAFAIGTVLGVGATLLLRHEPRSARERLMRDMKPYGKKVKKSARRVSRELKGSARATQDISGEVIEAGRELLGEFRAEVARILNEARDELSELAAERAEDARGFLSEVERRRGERRARERRAPAIDEAAAGPAAEE